MRYKMCKTIQNYRPLIDSKYNRNVVVSPRQAYVYHVKYNDEDSKYEYIPIEISEAK